MQKPMNTTIHRWSYSWYRSRYCPSSIVQDGGDTAINGTVLIYFRASPDLCHHVGRGINPHSRAITIPHETLREQANKKNSPSWPLNSSHPSHVTFTCTNAINTLHTSY